MQLAEAVEKIQKANSITFLTGAGVSTPSGIPDYRSLKGVYHGLEKPEYLLSTTCMTQEPDKFYAFVKYLYHPEAAPNVIHRKIAQLQETKNVWVVSQNIDRLHQQAGSRQLVDFHGNLYDCHCRKCGQSVPWQVYLEDWHHQDCEGQIRPEIVLYGEGFTDETIQQSVLAVQQAELIVVAGTSLQVYPFAGLLQYRQNAEVIVLNKTPVDLPFATLQISDNAEAVFSRL